MNLLYDLLINYKIVMNLTNGDSLLSNISNISVKIQHKPSDGSDFLKNYSRLEKNQMEVDLADITDKDSMNPSCLIDRIMIKNKQMHNHFNPNWMLGDGQGLSQQQDQSNAQNQVQKQPSQKVKSQMNNQQMEEQMEQIDQSGSVLDSNQSQNLRRKLILEKRLKNQTKNIPKNYGKAIITFIQKYSQKVRQVTQRNGIDYDEFVHEMKERKRTINTIADLRNLWIDYKYAKEMRLLSNLFLRKYSLNYIFNSRICNYGSHIKYRYRLCEAIKEPKAFKHIKDY